MLVAVLTQHEPLIVKRKDGRVAIPDTIPQPFYGIAERCLRFDPQRRCTINEVLGKPKFKEPPPAKAIEKPGLAKRGNVWVILPFIAAVILLAVLFGRRSDQPPVPAAENASNTIPGRCQRSCRSIACSVSRQRGRRRKLELPGVECSSRSYPRSRRAPEHDPGSHKISVSGFGGYLWQRLSGEN